MAAAVLAAVWVVPTVMLVLITNLQCVLLIMVLIIWIAAAMHFVLVVQLADIQVTVDMMDVSLGSKARI